MINTQKTYSKS